MSNPEKAGTSKDKEEDEEEKATDTDQAVTAPTTTTTTTTIVVTPPTRRRTVQVRSASGESKRSKRSADKGAGSTSSAKTGKRKSGQLDAPKGEPRCPICGRTFGSWKGYFGHLRVHRDRTWPGAFPPPKFDSSGKEIVDEEFQNYVASELARIGQETLRKMRHERSSTSTSTAGTRNVAIDLNVAPEDDPQHTAEFDLNLPPQSNINSDDDDSKKNVHDDDDAPAP